MDYFKGASLNERIELKKLTNNMDVVVFPTSSKGSAHFDAVIKKGDTIWVTEIKTRTKVEATCLIEKYKYDNLIHIKNSVDFATKIMFITCDATGHYIFDLTTIDLKPYFMVEMGWKTNKDRMDNKPQQLLERYRIPKELAKHVVPKDIEVDVKQLEEEEKKCEYIRYRNEFGLNNNLFLTKINKLLAVNCPIRKM